MSEKLDETLIIGEAATNLKARKRTVYRLASSRNRLAFALGGTRRFRLAKLDQWIAGSTGRGANPDQDGGEE